MIKSQPKGLYVLFLSEMWERFSFYGLRALIVLYMTKVFLFGDHKAYDIYGAYTALVYATPVIGGYIADRWLGFKRAIILGGILIALGHFCLALPGGHELFYLGLGFVICGTGFFKSNVSSMVGQLYQQDDPRRDAGFTLFYMGINVGAFFAALVCGVVAEIFGWHYGFGLAGIGMVIGLIIFLSGQQYLKGIGLPTNPERLTRKILSFIRVDAIIYGLSFAAVPLLSLLLFYKQWVGYALAVMLVAAIIVMLVVAFRSDKTQRNKIFVLLALMIFTIFFFAFYEQAGSSLTLFAERAVDRNLFGWTVPTAVYQSLVPFFIIILAPFFAIFWVKLANKNLEPSTPFKFFFGLLFLSLGFAVLALGGLDAQKTGLANMSYLVIGYLLHTLGELCLSPIGLSAVTQLAPQRMVGMMMGVWFLAISFSNHLAAQIAKLTSAVEGQTVTAGNYTNVFTTIFIAGMIISVVALILTPLLKRMMNSKQTATLMKAH